MTGGFRAVGLATLAGVLLLVSALAGCGKGVSRDLLSPEERRWLTENQGRIVLGVETNSAPLVFLDPQGQPTGLAHDHLVLLEAKLGVRFQRRPLATLDELLEQTRSGGIQVVNAVMETPLRAEFLSFTKPFLFLPNVILVRKDRPGTLQEEDLRGLRVSLVRGFATTERLTDKPLGLVPDLVPDDLTGILNVSFGHSDAGVFDLATASYLIHKNGITNLRMAGETGRGMQLSMATPKNQPQLLQILEKGLGAITQAEREEIRGRWINAASPSLFADGRFWLGAGIVLLVLLMLIAMVLIWNRTLRRQVRLRTQELSRGMEAVEESEERYRTFFMHGPDGIVVLDPATRRPLAFNDQACRQLGYTREEFASLTMADIEAMETAQQTSERIRGVMIKGHDDFETLQRTRLGALRNIHVTAQYIRTKGVSTYHCVWRDITERRRMEEALGQRTGELATLLEVSRSLSATIDLNAILQTATNRIAELTDLKTAAVYRLSGEMLRMGAGTPPLPPQFPEELRLAPLAEHPHILEALATRKPVFLLDTRCTELTPAERAVSEARGLRSILYLPLIAGANALGVLIASSVGEPRAVSEADQGFCQTLVNVAAIAIANGQLYEASQAHGAELEKEIIERKRAETALGESVRHYRDLFDQANEGLLIMTRDGQLAEVNRAFAEMHGYRVEEMIGFDIKALDVRNERTMEDRGEFIRRMQEGEVVRFEVAHYHKDGHVFPLSVTTSLIELGDQAYYLAFHQDITERRQAEEDHRKLQTQLQQSQKMESLGTLAGGVAHDMNNVLGAILGLASAHIGTQPYGSPLHQALDTIVKATERGGKMVKSLLNFARQSPAEENELDMNALLREQVSLLERTTLAKVDLQVDLEAGLHPILGDASALTHAFMNLCVNAVDAMPESGTLTLHTRNVDSDWIEVVVEDNGTGMPREVVERAMDPFFTTKGVGKGTGLGLSMVYSTVMAHRGRMTIESEPGRGTRVRLLFPVCEKEGLAAESGVSTPAAVIRRSLKVLLVDDDDLVQRSVQALLEVMGHNAVTAVLCGEDALAMLEAGLEPDLVILDMNMPGLGGIGTLPRLRALSPAVPVLLSTGRADQTALTLASAHPGVTLLSKPFGLRELQSHLESIGLG